MRGYKLQYDTVFVMNERVSGRLRVTSQYAEGELLAYLEARPLAYLLLGPGFRAQGMPENVLIPFGEFETRLVAIGCLIKV